MPTLITTKSGDKFLVDEWPTRVYELMQCIPPDARVAFIELKLHRTTPTRNVYINPLEIESIKEDHA